MLNSPACRHTYARLNTPFRKPSRGQKTNFSRVPQIKKTNFLQGEIYPMNMYNEFETISHLMHPLSSKIWIHGTFCNKNFQ